MGNGETKENNVPLISIILPTYNRAHLIGETIQSVIDQTYKNWELIIVDDGSTDNTFNIIKTFEDLRIQYHNIKHSGLHSVARNHGIEKALGNYVAFLDSDDLWRVDKLNFQINLFNDYPDSFFVFSNIDQFGEDPVTPPEMEELFFGNVFLPTLVENRFCFYPSSLVFKKEVIARIGFLNWDVSFFYLMSYSFSGIFTNERLVKIRKHSHNTSKIANIKSLHNYLAMITEFRKNGFITKQHFKKLSSRCHYKTGLFYFQHKKTVAAVVSFLKYTAIVPWHWKGWARMLQASVQGITNLIKVL